MYRDDPRLEKRRQALREHPLYTSIRTPNQVRTFQQLHVYCVWDFMSLLKSLQRRLTCVNVPWLPPADPAAARLINEIVLGEESDSDGEGGHCSHFDLYLRAMKESGADTSGMERFLQALRQRLGLDTAFEEGQVPVRVREFVRLSLALAQADDVLDPAAAFALGREDIIPGMFLRMLESLARSEPLRFGRLLWYLRRHVEVDGDEHGPAAEALLARLCEGDLGRQERVISVACRCLDARIAVWDEILAAL